MRLDVVRNASIFLMVVLTGAAARGQTNSRPSAKLLSVVMPATAPADFGGSISPAYRTIVPGATTTYEITVFPINGFTADVTLIDVEGLPREATATFNPSVIPGGSGTSTLTISTSRGTRPRSYRLIIRAEGGGITHTDGVNLNVGPPGKDFGDFGGSVSPGYQTIVPGASTTFEISVFPINGFSGDVSLSDVDGLPQGATATFNPSVIASGLGTSTLSISTPGSTPTATYHLMITGTGGDRRHTNGMGLNVGPEGTDFTDYTGTVTPQSQTVGLGQSTTFTLMIEPLFGTGCVYLQASGLPPATGGHFDRTTGICGGTPATTVYTITTSAQTPPGKYTLTFLGTTSGGHEHSRNVTLEVTSCASGERTSRQLDRPFEGDGAECKE